MKDFESRRIMPLGHVAMVAVGVLVVFELAVAGGMVRLPAGIVAKYAPWAYEPFLKMVGEHPDVIPAWVATQKERENPEKTASTGIGTVAEMGEIPLSVLQEANTSTSAVHSILEPSIPLFSEPEEAEVISPTDENGEFIPVG
jgi:hypothetical protein